MVKRKKIPKERMRTNGKSISVSQTKNIAPISRLDFKKGRTVKAKSIFKVLRKGRKKKTL